MWITWPVMIYSPQKSCNKQHYWHFKTILWHWWEAKWPMGLHTILEVLLTLLIFYVFTCQTLSKLNICSYINIYEWRWSMLPTWPGGWQLQPPQVKPHWSRTESDSLLSSLNPVPRSHRWQYRASLCHSLRVTPAHRDTEGETQRDSGWS